MPKRVPKVSAVRDPDPRLALVELDVGMPHERGLEGGEEVAGPLRG